MFLAIPVTPSYPLLDSLRIPGQIIIDNQGTKLEVYAFRPCFCCDHDFRLISEAIHQCGPHIRRLWARRSVGPLIFLQPFPVDFLWFPIVVGTIKEHYLALVFRIVEDSFQVFLRSRRFGKDHCLFAGAFLLCLGESPLEGCQEHLSLWILLYRPGQGVKIAQGMDFFSHQFHVIFGVCRLFLCYCSFFLLWPFFLYLIKGLEVLKYGIFKRGGWVAMMVNYYL